MTDPGDAIVTVWLCLIALAIGGWIEERTRR
jgi:hypothetical protein